MQVLDVAHLDAVGVRDEKEEKDIKQVNCVRCCVCAPFSVGQKASVTLLYFCEWSLHSGWLCVHVKSASSFEEEKHQPLQHESYKTNLVSLVVKCWNMATSMKRICSLCRCKRLILRKLKHNISYVRRLYTNVNILTSIIFNFCHNPQIDPPKSYMLDLQRLSVSSV